MSSVPTTTLGLRQADLSLSEVIEQIRDVRADIAVLEDYRDGRVPFSEVRHYTLFDTTDLTLLREALETLRAWRQAHLICH